MASHNTNKVTKISKAKNKIKIKIESQYTDEQLKYIEYINPNHTKLLACAGSGKTRCIIARINKLIELKVYKPTEILMLTFSRFTRDDFLNKIEKLDDTNKILTNSIKTIDSFAKQIIDTDNTIDVSLLSYKLMLYLESTDKKVLKKNEVLKKIKTVFIDEAQDLNEIQYNIFKALKEKLGIVVNMVGDPNQNIYQFRDSSDKYLTEFEAETFILTKNFRSHEHIVEFSKHLRPFTDNDVHCTKGDNGCFPIIMLYESESVLEEYILDILNSAIDDKIDLSDFAILSPTRGRMRGSGKSHGLCFVSNILYKAKIPFKQFYEESTDEISADGIKYEPKKGHVNILTYMGSKGLEWKYVLVIDADMCLINKRIFTEEKHKHDQYLLYVACSRAIDNMFIFSKCIIGGDKPKFMANPWFNLVPYELYAVDSRFMKHFDFPKLKYIDRSEKEIFVGKIIDRLDCYNLNRISDLIGYSSMANLTLKKRIFKKDYSSIEKSSAILLSKFVDALFHAMLAIKNGHPPKKYTDIVNIIESKGIVTNAPYELIEWYHEHKKNMTWEKFDNIKDENLKGIINLVNAKFDRSRDFDSHTMAINNYFTEYILGQRQWIKDVYKKYMECKNYKEMQKIVFDIIILIHSMDTQHYFHINSKGQEYINILNNFDEMYSEMESYVLETKRQFVSENVAVEGFDMIGKIDLIDDENKSWEIKCVTDISLKHIIKSIILHIMKNGVGSTSIDINFINFLKGEEISYRFNLSAQTVNEILLSIKS